MTSLAALLRRLRQDAGLTREALAERAGISVEAIGALEGGRRQYPRPTTLDRLADALEASADDRQRLTTAARRPKIGSAAHRLPPGIGDFTGREQQLASLVALLRSPAAAAPGIVVSTVGGMGGVGKTTLAVQAARQVTDVFPDGQLYLNLRGGGGNPLESVDALRQLLQALGVTLAADSDDVQAIAARYRTALAGRQILLLLDDAGSGEQVLPLLPGTPGAVVVITSRSPLSTLPGAARISLDVLTEPEAVQLLARVAGPDRIDAEPTAAAEVVRRCGLLPLAIRIAGGQLRHGRLRELADELAADGLAVLTGPDVSVRRSISLSLDHLASSSRSTDRLAAKVFPALSHFDGERFPLRAAAKVLDLPLDEAEELLERLVDVHLVETPAVNQYRMHDLVREVGRELHSADPIEHRRRELNCYLSMLWRWDVLKGGVERYGSSAGWAAGAEDIVDLDEAARWLEDELPNLVRLVRTAAAGDADDKLLAVRLALGLPAFAVQLLRFADAREAVMAVADLDVDLPTDLEIGRLYQAGFLSGSVDLNDEAITWLGRALAAIRTAGTPTELVACLINLAHLLGNLGRVEEAFPYGEEALTVVAESGVERFEVGTNIVVGYLAGLVGDVDRQRASFDHALALMPERSAPGPATVHRTLIGSSLGQTGQYDAAVAMLERVIADAQSLAAEPIEATARGELGTVLLAMNNLPRAAEVLETGIHLAGRHPEERGEAPLLQTYGKVLTALGQPAQAHQAWQRAITVYERVADPRAGVVRELLSELEVGGGFGEGFEGGGDQGVVGSGSAGGDEDPAGGSRGLQGADDRRRGGRESQAGDQRDAGVGGAQGGY